ncbi:MAG: FKBP-type peptidyl-prolyl cis-trans isomerase [Hyphomicrobiaceae bacterium]|nr:FKBP-type peptidyl-prolyl cis-trans isomerase [Hyphomicrobiaceae bacterium]
MKRNVSIICMSFLLSLCATSVIADEIKLKGEADRISYSLGQQIGRDFKRQGVDLDAAALVRGFNDANTGAEPALAREEMNATLGKLKGRISAAQREEAQERRARKQRETEEKRRKGQEFLAENGSKPGVTTLPSGLQYKVIKSGTGKKPVLHELVKVHYRARLINGHEFDSSYRRNAPSSFRVGGVIAGWTEALQLMREGAKWELYIPPEFAYGKRGPLADQTIIYEIELLGVGEAIKAPESKPASSEQQ